MIRIPKVWIHLLHRCSDFQRLNHSDRILSNPDHSVRYSDENMVVLDMFPLKNRLDCLVIRFHSIIKILKLYIILLYTHLNHFFLVSICLVPRHDSWQILSVTCSKHLLHVLSRSEVILEHARFCSVFTLCDSTR